MPAPDLLGPNDFPDLTIKRNKNFSKRIDVIRRSKNN